ncbi:hypothetical protein Fcan01_12246 [Folsomia candida]|uniref:Uncharacterized protein n=1 Tax=Folsomia candida TaxID=158441 RepID=A0A226E7D8_FOLCA|nr:hypothetical protein Fcan01_12246 [Folsomia candida]
MYRLNSPFGPSTIRTEKKKEVRATRRGNAAAAAVALEVLLVKCGEEERVLVFLGGMAIQDARAFIVCGFNDDLQYEGMTQQVVYPVLSFDSPSPALLCYHVGVVALYPDHVTSTQFGIEWPGIFRDWRLKKKKKSDLEWNFRTRGNEPTISPSSHHPISSNQAEPTLFYPIFYPLLVSFSPCRPAPTTKPNNVLAGEEEIPLLICDWESDQIQIFCSVLASM